MELDWYQLLCLIGIPSICATLVVKMLTAIKMKISDNRLKEKEHEALVAKEKQETSARVEQKFLLLEAAMQALLRRKLREIYFQCVKQGYASMEDKDDFELMYQRYHTLGVNGVMDNVRKQFFLLPSERPEKKKKKKQEGDEQND